MGAQQAHTCGRGSLAFATFGESKVERKLVMARGLSVQIYEHKKMNTTKTINASQTGTLPSSLSGSERLIYADLKNEH